MTAPFEQIVAALNDRKPDLLTAYGGFLDAFYRTVVARGNRVALVTAQGPRLILMRRGDASYTVAEDPMVEAPIAMSLQHEPSQLSEAETSAVPPLQ